jgi:hypothetical protein
MCQKETKLWLANTCLISLSVRQFVKQLFCFDATLSANAPPSVNAPPTAEGERTAEREHNTEFKFLSKQTKEKGHLPIRIY